jgi:hypothetical protein
MRSRFTDPSLSQGEKAKFGKSQISRVRTAYDEAHIQDTTEERVVYDRRKINEAGPPGGKASTGASCVLSRIGKGVFIQCMDLNKGYWQGSCSRVASAWSGTKVVTEDGEVIDAVWAVYSMGDRSSSTNHYTHCVIPRLVISRLLDPMARCSLELNAPEHAYDSKLSSISGRGKGTPWYEIRGVDSDEDESEGDKPRIVDNGYHVELPLGDVWRCSDGYRNVECVALVDDSIFLYPNNGANDARERRIILMNLYLRWVLNLITGVYDNESKRTKPAKNSVPFFGVLVHSQGARQDVQYLSMPDEKKVKLLSLMLEFCWTVGVDLLSLMEAFVPIDGGAGEVVGMCLRSDSALGRCLSGLVTQITKVPRREAMKLMGFIHHVGSIVHFIARCTRQVYRDIYREGWGGDGTPSSEVDYDGDFVLTARAVGELALLVFLLHQPGQHMVVRRFRKVIYIAAQDASDLLHGGFTRVGHRYVVHTHMYDKTMQAAGSTPKELHAISVGVQVATAEFKRVVGMEGMSPEKARKWMQLVLEGEGEVGTERVVERILPESAGVDEYEEHDISALCVICDNTPSVAAAGKGMSANEVMQQSCDELMVSCVQSDMELIAYHTSGKEMEENGIDDASRGKAGGLRSVGEMGLNTTASVGLNPFARQDWSLPLPIREFITEQYGDGVKFFACGLGLTAVNCAHKVVCIYPTPSTAVQLVDQACEVWDLCKHSMTLILVCVKNFATKHMGSLLRRFDKQSNGQHSRILPKAPGDVWARYFAIKRPSAHSRITNSILFKYCNELANVQGDEAATNAVLKYWLARYGPATSGVADPSVEDVIEALGSCQCDVAALNEHVDGRVLMGGEQKGQRPEMGTTSYQPFVRRSKKDAVIEWGVFSELRVGSRKRGHIVQQVTEILSTQGETIVRRYTQGWKVFRQKVSMRTALKGRSAFSAKAADLAIKGSRQYRMKAYFVPGDGCKEGWQGTRDGLPWCTGHIFPPAPGEPVLCRYLQVSWDPLQLPTFEGSAFAATAQGVAGAGKAGVSGMTRMSATQGGTPTDEARPAEPQGAELCFAAGLGRKTAASRPVLRGPRFSLAPRRSAKEISDRPVVGDLRGRKLTASTRARSLDASAGCTRCLEQVLLSDALVCCYRRKEIPFAVGPPGGRCGSVICVRCFNADIDEDGYPNWQDEPQRLLTPAHARMICNSVCAPCRYSICCDRSIPERDDDQYRYSMELITQYMVDMYSHLALNTTASYGQQINLLLDFLDAAPELSSELIFGGGEIDRVVLANCTMTGMVMLHQANCGLSFNGIRSMRSAVRKMWASRVKEPPTDHPEFAQFIKGITERMGNETGTKWAMPVEVMQALVAMATEDANSARAEGDGDGERELRTKAMYYLVCYLIWPRPGAQKMISLRQIAKDLMYPARAERLSTRPHVRVVLSKPTKKMRSRPVTCGRCDRMAHANDGSGRYDGAADPVVRGDGRWARGQLPTLWSGGEAPRRLVPTVRAEPDPASGSQAAAG